MKYILNLMHSIHKETVEMLTAYGASFALMVQQVDWTVVGGVVLFIARAAVDIPTAIDYWKKRKKK